MKNTHTEKGFTLVELAIVMTIIGLLIGGILKGQELMENARVTATIAQVRAYEAATTTFKDAYNGTPGDMLNAELRLPGCTAVLCDATTAGTNGDSFVGANDDLGTITNITARTDEAVMFWAHLSHAGLIGGVTDSGAFAWGEALPAAKIGGGFHVGSGDGTTNLSAGSLVLQPTGLSLVLKAQAATAANITVGAQALTPLRAAQIDRKMDDGDASTGYVRGYGAVPAAGPPATNGCAAGTTATSIYAEAVPSKECGLVFRIQN